MTEEASLKGKYAILSPHYELLGNRLKNSLEKLLNKNKISFQLVDFRVKTFDSFCHKIRRFDYKNPFNQINDICGLRIICFYHSDIYRINQLIKDEFKDQLLEVDIKSSDIDVMRFSYRSWHYLLKFKEEWLKEIEFEAYFNFRVEIQVRTVVMHTWAEIEHEISYKQNIPASDSMKRRLSRVSALLEMVDEQFDRIREEKDQHLDSLIFQPRIDFKTLELDFDNFQKMLDTYFPYRVSSLYDSKKLYYEITHLGIDLIDLVNQIERIKEILPVIEEDWRKLLLAEKKPLITDEEKLLRLVSLRSHQDGALTLILSILNDQFWEKKRGNSPINFANFIIKWRSKLRGP